MEDRFKFRAWDMERGEMSYSDLYTLIDRDVLGFLSEWGSPDESEQYEKVLMQCTGLRDKNGKLIYEGDILKTGSTFPENATIEVKWGTDDSDGGYISGFSFGYFWPKECEIIGNIYEHKHLLKND